MNLIIALGNPGSKYQNTRHNAGQILTQKIWPNAKWSNQPKLKAITSKQTDLILAKPMVFMNQSGEAVAKIVGFYKIKPENILLIHDDSDIILGKYKLQKNKSPAGHKGVESIINHLGTQNFWRLRVGIRPKDNTQPADEMVLKKFSKSEEDILNSFNIDGIKTKIKNALNVD